MPAVQHLFYTNFFIPMLLGCSAFKRSACAVAGVGQFAHRHHSGGTQCSLPTTGQLLVAVSVSQPQ